MKKFRTFDFWVSAALTLVAFLTGGANVMIAAAGDIPEGGHSESGVGSPEVHTAGSGAVTPSPVEPAGIATETQGRATAAAMNNDEFYLNDIDQKIVKIRPMSTPVDQISRYANSSKTDSFICKYYSVGTRPLKTTVSTETTFSSGSSVALPVADPTIFTVDDTILVPGIKAETDYKGSAYSGANTPDLVLCVCGKATSSSNNPVVFAINGKLDETTGSAIFFPDATSNKIAAGQVLIRMGKACGELDVQTGRFNNAPKPDIQYCQNFMIQVEQSTFDKIAAKEVNWGFSDLEEDSLYDMRLTQELSELFGDMAQVNHVAKENMTQWFTKGIWWMAGKDCEVGVWDTASQCAKVTFNSVVDLAQDVFVGAGTGNKKKIILAGSDMVNAFSKIDTDNIRRTGETVKKWNLEFTSIKTGFGEFLLIHHELFDQVGKSDEGFLLDPEYLSKRVHLGWQRNVLDLKKAGIRNSDAVVLQEVACLYLRYPNAHARLKLAQAPVLTLDESSKTVTAGTSAVIDITAHDGKVSVYSNGATGATVTVADDSNSFTIAVTAGTSAQSNKEIVLTDEHGSSATFKLTTN